MYRVIAHDVHTGEPAWSRLVERSSEGSTFDAIKGARDRVYVVIDGRLVVLDAGAGRLLASVSSATLPE